MRSSKTLLWLSLLFFCRCSTPEIQDISWLEGSWKHRLGDDAQLEHWAIKKDTLFGQSWLARETDSILMQEMRLYEYEGNIQLAIFPVDAPYNLLYEAELETHHRIVFRNVQPIFPEILEYQLNNDTLFLYQKGKTQGMINEARIEFIPVESVE